MSTPMPAPGSNWRARLATWLTSSRIEICLIILILVNALILGLETYPGVMARWGTWLTTIDRVILGIFVVEIGLRIAAHGWRFFRDPWGIFDFSVVAIALIPASGAFAVLRSLRILRVLRIISLVPSMRRVIGGLLTAIPGLSSVIAVMALIFYVGSVIATKLFGEAFPQWFGTLGESAYSLFQVMTLESWSMGIARPVIEVFPAAWVFFVVFIMTTTFTILNLFIGVIVSALQAEHERELIEAEEQTSENVDAQHEITRQEISALREEVRQLQQLLVQNRSVGPQNKLE